MYYRPKITDFYADYIEDNISIYNYERRLKAELNYLKEKTLLDWRHKALRLISEFNYNDIID